MSIEPKGDVVVSVVNADMTPVKNLTFKVIQLRQAFQTGIRQFVAYDWLEQGVECEVLSPTGGGWKKGRLRLRLEFIPNEPDPTESSALAPLPNSDQ